MPAYLFYPACFIFGLLIGSFLNVVILRLPAGENLTGRSRCPRCGRILKAWELVPLVSYLILRGRCSACKAKISPRYFIIEFACASLFLIAGHLAYPASGADFAALLRHWTIIAVLLAVFVMDLEHFLIFDELIFYGLALLLPLNLVYDLISGSGLASPQSHFFGGAAAAVLLSGLFYLLWFFSKGRALGFGDVKLALFLGAALGWPLAFLGLFLAVMIGGAVSVVLLATSAKKLKDKVPFGTFLGLGWIAALFFGEKMLNWYLALLGF